MASRTSLGLDGAWLLVDEPMLRWLVLGGLVLGLGTGFSKGWIEMRWGRLLADLGLPYVADPGDLGDCPPPPGASTRAGSPAAARSSARQAR
jgi:hypothetical protein